MVVGVSRSYFLWEEKTMFNDDVADAATAAAAHGTGKRR